MDKTSKAKTSHLGHVTQKTPQWSSLSPGEKEGGFDVGLRSSIRKNALATETKTTQKHEKTPLDGHLNTR